MVCNFEVTNLVSKNAAKLNRPGHSKIHSVVHVSHKTPFVEQSNGIPVPTSITPRVIPKIRGDELVVQKIQGDRK